MKISVVTPSYNSGKYIQETIESIKNQSYQNFEHIVIDGASQDDTLDIVKRYDHIKYISEKDRGQSHALNKGFSMAEGDILAWQNADDLYFPETFNTVVNYFKKNKKIDIVYGYYQLINSDSQLVCDVYPMEWDKWMFSHGRFCPLQPTVFWRRQVFDSVGHLNESLHYCMDVDFFSRTINKGFNFSRIPEMMGKFRIHDLSKTQNRENEKKVRREYKNVLSSNFNYGLLDAVLFDLFQIRARVTKSIKQNILKKARWKSTGQRCGI